jgi:hypothetical protein
MNSTFHFDGSVMVRNTNDPLIFLGNITMGTMDLNSAVKNQTTAGREFFFSS